jgi:hypothetical protein
VTEDDDGFTPEQRKPLPHSAALWLEAQEIVAKRPDLNVNLVYQILQNLQLSPAERLWRGLSRIRLKTGRPSTGSSTHE